MSFNRSGYIGRAPGDSSIVLAKQYFQPTGAGKTFTFTSGYDPGLIDVYRNGVKLINTLDYAATDGSTVVLDTPVGVGSTVQIVAYKGFNVTEVSSSAGDFSVGSNLYVQSGFGSFAQGITANQIDVSGIGTIGIGSFVDINVSGAATVAGTLIANSFSGDGSALTGLANTDFIVSVATTTGNLNVSAAATITGDLTVSDSIAVTKDLNVGAATTISGIFKVANTTDSTSTSTGALQVAGGAGFGANVYIGAGLSVAGTLTYEDVTSVDSVGLITAKSGVNVTGGQVTIGTGITMGIAGVATFSGTSDVHLLDNVKLNVGDGSDLSIYHDGTNSYISDTGTGSLIIKDDAQIVLQSDILRLKNEAGNNSYITADNGAAVGLRYNNTERLTTTDSGTVTTGIATATGGLAINADSKNLTIGASEDLKLFHDGSHSVIHEDGTGALKFVSANSFQFRDTDKDTGDYCINANIDGAVSLYYNGSKKWETTNDGTVTTGIGTFSNRVCVESAGTFLKSNQLSFYPAGNAFIDHTIEGHNITFRVSSPGGSANDTNAVIVGATGITTFSSTPHDDKGSLRDIPLRSVTGSAATLVAADAGKVVSTNTTGWTVPASTFSEGDTVTLLNNSAGGLTITCSAVTTYLTSDGTTVTSKTLGARGLATLYFVSASVAYLQGTSLS